MSPPSTPPTERPDDRGQSDDDFQELIRRVRARDEAASERLYKLYERHVRIIVRRRLGQPLRTRYDSDDFCQDVWQIAFARIRDGLDFAVPAQFVAFLVGAAVNTTLKRSRSDLQTQKRSSFREEPISRRGGELLTRSVSGGDPAEQASTKEELAHVLAGLSHWDRSIIAGLRDGDRVEELARRLGISSKTLRRIVKRRRPIVDGERRGSGFPA